MKLDKESNHHCLLFCFHQKKNADAHRFIKRMMKMLWNVCEIGLNNLKNGVFDINDKERYALQL